MEEKKITYLHYIHYNYYMPSNYHRKPILHTYETEKELMAVPNIRIYIGDYNYPSFYIIIGQMQVKYEFMTDLLNI